MDITDIKLGMGVRTKRGKVGKVKAINRVGVVIELPDGEEYGAGFNCIEPEYASGISIEDIRLGMKLVTTGGIQGKVVAISKEGGLWLETEDRTRFPVHVECVRPTDESCTECQKLEEALEYWQNSCMSARRDADYWHDKLEKLQQEACALAPIGQVAKCYKQVKPEDLFLSEDAKLVCEFVRANGPTTSYEISERLHMLERCVLSGLIEAKEAGIVRLDDGKYSIVRD